MDSKNKRIVAHYWFRIRLLIRFCDYDWSKSLVELFKYIPECVLVYIIYNCCHTKQAFTYVSKKGCLNFISHTSLNKQP